MKDILTEEELESEYWAELLRIDAQIDAWIESRRLESEKAKR